MADDEGVVLRQTMLNVEEAFLYTIPPLKTAGGHRAEDWNLSKPIETCTLLVERCGDQLHLIFRKQTDNSLFARSVIDLSSSGKHELQYYCEEVVDSSRYFCIRITDDKSGREARVGVGFRERDFASNFRMSLQDYQSSLQRERKAHELQEAYENGSVDYDDDKAFSLKEGEKIHVNLGGKSTISKGVAPPTVVSPILLKKPPPSPAQHEQLRISLEDMQIPDESERRGDDSDDDSDCAVADDQDHDSLN